MKRMICRDAQHLYDFRKPVQAYRFSYVPFKGTKHIEPPACNIIDLPPYALEFTPSEWIAREKRFTPAEFAAWLRAADVLADARPMTGLYQDGERIGQYSEQDGGNVILVTIY